MDRWQPDERLEKVCVAPDVPIAEAIPVLDRGGLGILLLCESDGRLAGVLTDGDVRRAILRQVPFTEPCIGIATHAPVVAPRQITPYEALQRMDGDGTSLVDHLPLVDEQGRAVGLLVRSDLVNQEQLALSAVVMAGGQGTRLRPLTDLLPKPMLPIGDRPLLELMIEQLRQGGIKQVNLTTHYRPEAITSHFGDGRGFGVEIHYVNEDQPLGTAGALSLLDQGEEPLLVINGDILTRVDFRSMLEYHRSQRADMTVGVRQQEFMVPYGIVETDGSIVTGIREKPVLRYFINAGIYLLSPAARRYIPDRQRYDMTDLIAHLLSLGRPVASFPIREYWLDVGQLADYERAQEDLRAGKVLS